MRRLKAVTERAGVSQAAVVEAGVRSCLTRLERRLRDETQHETHETVKARHETVRETNAVSVPETVDEPGLPDPDQSPPDLLGGLQAMLGDKKKTLT